MTLTPISSISALAPGTVLAGIRGVVKNVAEHYADVQTMSDGSQRPWSRQWLILAGKDGAEISVEVLNKPAVPVTAVGCGLCLLSTESANKRLFGVKVDDDVGARIIRLTAKGEMNWVEAEVAQPAPKTLCAGEPPMATATAAVSAHAASAAASSPAPFSPPTGTGTAAPPPPAKAPIGVPAGAAGAFGERTAQIMDLVHLYDMCLSAVVMNIGKGMADESGFLMTPEGTHFTARAIFDRILQRQEFAKIEELRDSLK